MLMIATTCFFFINIPKVKNFWNVVTHCEIYNYPPQYNAELEFRATFFNSI